MDELTLEDLVKWHAAQARAALDVGRAVGTTKAIGLGQRWLNFTAKLRCCWVASNVSE